MKIVVSATGRDIESNIDSNFHRCAFFLIVDTKSNSLVSLMNTARESQSEIGAMVGQIVANKGIDSVITASIGPKAFEIFETYGIKVYQGEGKVNNAILQLEEGVLPEITKAALLIYMKREKKMKK